MYYLLKTFPAGHYHLSFMATEALRRNYVRLHVVGIKDATKAQINTRPTRIIKHTNKRARAHTHTHTYIN